MFIFVLQTIWLYISELAGRGLDIVIVLKFLWFVSPRLIPLVLPLTILVTSLMVFGNFSENYEFAAMKSNGISLQRAMKSLTIFILLLSVTAFFFANNVIPYSEYKWLNLRRNISQFKPSMVIAEGQFSQIGDNFNIKVAEKYGDDCRQWRISK
jgi:lipopolysaccharide export system permease protein